jgi:flagellar basal body-associated protein FliL
MADEKENGREEVTNNDGKGRSKSELDRAGLAVEEITAKDAEKDQETDKPKETPQKKGVGKKEYSMIGISLLLVLIVTISGVFIWARYFSSDNEEILALNAPQGVVYELKPFFLPLKTKAKSKKFMRMTLILELYDESSDRQIKKRIEEVRNRVFKVLTNVSPTNIENNRGKKLLSEEIISIINLVLAGKVIKNVYFRDIVVI